MDTQNYDSKYDSEETNLLEKLLGDDYKEYMLDDIKDADTCGFCYHSDNDHAGYVSKLSLPYKDIDDVTFAEIVYGFRHLDTLLLVGNNISNDGILGLPSPVTNINELDLGSNPVSLSKSKIRSKIRKLPKIKVGKHKTEVKKKIPSVTKKTDKITKALNHKGFQCRGKGKYDEAISYFDKSLDLDPQNEMALGLKGLTYYEQRDFEKSISFLDKSLEINPESVRTWILKASACFEIKDYDEAINCYDKVLEIDPENVEAWNRKAFIYHENGKMAESLECYNRSKELDPNSSVMMGLGDGFYSAGKGKNSRKNKSKSSSEILGKEPKDFNGWKERGGYHYSRGEYTEAIKCFDRALEFNQKDMQTLSMKAMSYYQNGEEEEAEKCYAIISKLDAEIENAKRMKGINKPTKSKPKGIYDWSNKGIMHHVKDDYDEAIKCYNRALELSPQNTTALTVKGLAYDMNGDYYEALECYDKALEIDPQSVSLWNKKGSAHYENEDYDNAIDCFDKALEINPQDYTAKEMKILANEGKN